MKAIIPAAGYATRMHPLTLDNPKALLKVANKPIIEYIIQKILRLNEVNEIFIVTNSKFFDRFVEWRKNFHCEVPISIIDDGTKSNEERFGTIGDVQLVLKTEKINEDILIVNSDNIFSFDLFEIYRNFMEKKTSVIGLFDVRNLNMARMMGNPYLDLNNKIIHFKEKDQNAKSTLCSIGIYLFPSRIIPLIELYIREGNNPDKSGDFIEWLYTKENVFGHIFNGKWFDIGSIDSYREAKENFNESNSL